MLLSWPRTWWCVASRTRTWSGAWPLGEAGGPKSLTLFTNRMKNWGDLRLACEREGSTSGTEGQLLKKARTTDNVTFCSNSIYLAPSLLKALPACSLVVIPILQIGDWGRERVTWVRPASELTALVRFWTGDFLVHRSLLATVFLGRTVQAVCKKRKFSCLFCCHGFPAVQFFSLAI